MTQKCSESRRDFLKTSAAGTVGLMVTGSTVKKAFSKPRGGWQDGMQINSDIDNLRVVFAHDEEMVTDQACEKNFEKYNTHIDSDKVALNMDKMAMVLAQKSNATTAWSTILRKPDAKKWSNVTVAIKINGIGNMHCSVGILTKLCAELSTLGITNSNITIYDSCHGAIKWYENFKGNGLPDDINVVDKPGVYDAVVEGGNLSCTTVVQNVDIHINCANCKNHGQEFGGFTMILKNLIGTLKFRCPSPGITQQFNIYKSEAILGNPSDTVPAKTQLCLIDCLFGSVYGGSGGNADQCLSTLVMGTFGPSVDFMTAKKIREDIMNATHPSNLNDFITAFDYTEDECTKLLTLDPADNDGKGWVNAGQQAINSKDSILRKGFKNVTVTVSGHGFKPVSTLISYNEQDKINSVTIRDIKGRLIRYLPFKNQNKKLVNLTWNGGNSQGKTVHSGMYIICVNGMNSTYTKKITLQK